MIKEDKLYRLIHSLNANEKGFFKKSYKHYSNHENILLFKLFDIYNNCKEYDEEIIEKALVKAEIKKQEGKLKSYLYQGILDSLISSDKHKSSLDIVLSLIQEVRMLIKKHLFHEAAIRLNKAKKISQEFELYDAYSIVLRMEISLYPSVDPNPIKLSKLMKANISESKKIEQNKKDETIGVQLYSMMLTNLETIGIETLESVQEKSRLLFANNEINESELSRRNELLFLTGKALLSIVEQNKVLFFAIEKELFEKVLEKKYQNCIGAAQKIHMIANLRFGFKEERDENYFQKIIETCKILFKQIPKSQPTDIKQIENTLFYLEIEKALAEKKYAKFISSFVNLIKEEKKNSDDQITSNLITSYFNLGLLYFYSKDYKEAIRTLNQIYLKTNKDYSPIKESEIIFIMILANIKLKQSDAIEILAKDYVTVYQRNNLHLPLRKKIVDEIYKNPFLDSGKMLANIKKTLDTSKEFDFVYSESLIDLKDWLQNH